MTNEKDYNNYVSKALSILKEIIKNMGIEKVSYKVSQEETEAMIIIEGEEASFLIGHHGETMSALQYLLSLSVNRKKDDYFRIILNIENYREKREKTLEAFAIKSAKNVVKTGRSQLLEPMNPYERRIIHAAVQKVDGAISSSIGEEPNRKVVIKSKNPRKPYNKRNNYDNKKPYDNKRPYDQNRNYKPYNTNNKPQEQTKSTTSNEVKEKKSDVNFGSLYGKIDLD
ncbi:MAG: RNA-binding cell elongation regulator Jag/EloR [Oscillospiraceae bacterium]